MQNISSSSSSALLDKHLLAVQDIESLGGLLHATARQVVINAVLLRRRCLREANARSLFVVEVDDKNIYSGGRILNRELFLSMRNAGVEVPFPQLDVHQD